MLKSRKFIPTIVQYFNWSMPSKHGFLGLIIGFVSLLFAVTTFIYSHKESHEEIVNKIEEANTKRDLYNLMYGRLVIYNPTVLPYGPEKHLLNVSSESDYFRRSLMSLKGNYRDTHRKYDEITQHSDWITMGVFLIPGKQSKKIEKAVELQIKQIEKLKEYKTTLINSVVTGEFKVPHIDSQ